MTPSLFFTLSHLPICICLYLLVWYWNCNVSVTGAILLLRVRLHLIRWCACPALVFPAVSSNTDKNGFNSAWGAAVSTPPHSADAHDCCCLYLQAKSSQCNSSCMHIYARITLTTMLHITGDLGLHSFQRRAKRYSLSQWDAQAEETHFARSGHTAKKVLVVFYLQLCFAFL